MLAQILRDSRIGHGKAGQERRQIEIGEFRPSRPGFDLRDAQERPKCRQRNVCVDQGMIDSLLIIFDRAGIGAPDRLRCTDTLSNKFYENISDLAASVHFQPASFLFLVIVVKEYCNEVLQNTRIRCHRLVCHQRPAWQCSANHRK
jgi:hypothetical protein